MRSSPASTTLLCILLLSLPACQIWSTALQQASTPACIHPHSIARIASASLHARLSSSSSTTHPSLYPSILPSPTYPQRRSACVRLARPPPRVMPAIHPICPAPGPAHARPASSSLAQHGQPVRLVALCRARRPPEVRRAETRPGSRRPVQCCVRSSALRSQIANTRPLRSPACSSSSLPASRNWHRRPVRPSRSFTTNIPTMPRTRRIMLPCTIHPHHPARTSPHIFFFLRLPWRPKAMYRRQGGLPPYRGARLHQPAPDVAHKAAEQARELAASAETLAPARPISSQTSIPHLQAHTTTRNTSAGPHNRSARILILTSCFHVRALCHGPYRRRRARQTCDSPLKPAL